MTRIPTLIPQSWVDQWRNYWNQRRIDKVWQFLLVVGGVTLIVIIIAGGPGFILAFLIGTTLSVILSDDIRQTISDVWNRNFWVWKV